MLLVRRIVLSALCALSVFFAPFSSADAQEVLALPAVATYNGFINMTNVLECSNLGADTAQLLLTMNRSSGALVEKQGISIPPSGTTHVILNEFADSNGVGIADDHGTVLIELGEGQSGSNVAIACLTGYYRNTSTMEYAFAVPVSAPDVGAVSVIYNSFDPSQGGIPTQNWFSIYNPNSSGTLSGSVYVYGQDGTLENVVPVSLNALNRTDIALGHPHGQRTGLAIFIPDDNTPHGSFLSRYHVLPSGVYDFAFDLATQVGTCNTSVFASTVGNATNWLELGNPNATKEVVTVEVRGVTGQLMHSELIVIDPYMQVNFYINQYLAPSGGAQVGSVRVTCDDPSDRLLIQSAYYGHPSSSALETSWAYVSQAKEGVAPQAGDSLVGFYNTFLGAANWAKFSNSLNTAANLQLDVRDQSGMVLHQESRTVAGLGTLDYGVHEHAAANTVGTFWSTSPESNGLRNSELLRVYLDSSGNIIEIMPTDFVVYDGSGGDPGGGGPGPGPGPNNPIANAGPDEDATVGELVTLDGRASSDPGNNPLSYFWTFTQQPVGSRAVLANSTSAQPSFTPDIAGLYVVQLIVGNGTLFSTPDTVVFDATHQNVRWIGPTREFTTFAAAAAAAEDGDVFYVDPVLFEGSAATAIWTKRNILVRSAGPGRARLDAAGFHAQGKGTWVNKQPMTVEGLEFFGATVPDGNGAGIRIEDDITVRDCYFHHNQNGLMSSGGMTGQVWIEFSIFDRNGWAQRPQGADPTHNMYMNHNGDFVLLSSSVGNTQDAHNVKTRSDRNYILYNRIIDDDRSTTASYQIDIVQGGLAIIQGNVIQQGPNDDNSAIIYYSSFTNTPPHQMFLVNNTIVNERSTGRFVRMSSTGGNQVNVTMTNNLLVGKGTILAGSIEPELNATIHIQQLDNAGLANWQEFDYRLVAGSPAIDAGTDPGSYLGAPLTPIQQYVHQAKGEPRATVGAAIDIGGYEYNPN